MTRRTLFTPGRAWFNLADIVLAIAIAARQRRSERRRGVA